MTATSGCRRVRVRVSATPNANPNPDPNPNPNPNPNPSPNQVLASFLRAKGGFELLFTTLGGLSLVSCALAATL